MSKNQQQRNPGPRDDFVRYFAQDMQAWIERRAKVEGVHPLTFVRERKREIAETERYDVERTA